MPKAIIFSSFIAILLFSCGDKDKLRDFNKKYASISRTVTSADFPATQPLNFIKTGINFGGTTTNMIVIDTLLVICDAKDSILLHIISTQTHHELRQLIKRGKGKKQLLDIAGLIPTKDGKLWLYDLTLGKLVKIDLAQAIKDPGYEWQQEITLEGDAKNAISLCWVSDSLFTACSYMIRGHRYFSFNQDSKIIQKAGEMPPGHDNWPAENAPGVLSLRALEYPANIRKNPRLDEYVVAYSSTSRLEIYNDSKITHIINGPDQFEPLYVFKNTDQGNLPATTPESRFAHMAIQVDSQYIYSLYSGRDNFKTCGMMLLVFDWKGNPVKKIQFAQDYCYYSIGQQKGIPRLYSTDENTGDLVYADLH